jgi:hypothetical protein
MQGQVYRDPQPQQAPPRTQPAPPQPMVQNRSALSPPGSNPGSHQNHTYDPHYVAPSSAVTYPLNFPVLSNGAGRLDYYENVKGNLLKEYLFKEGERLASQTGMTAKQYAEFRLQEEAVRKQAALQNVPTLELMKIQKDSHFVGNSRISKQGFCGTSFKAIDFDLYVDATGDLCMKPLRGEGKTETFKGRFKDLKVSELDAILKYQQSPEGRQKIGNKQEELVVPPPGSKPQYVLGFSLNESKSGKEAGRNYFFFRDDLEVEKFRNTILSYSKIGQRFLDDPDKTSGSAVFLKKIIERRRVLLSESILHAMDRRGADWEANKKKKMSRDQMTIFLRRAAIKGHIKRELKENLSDDQKKKEILMRLLKNMSSKSDDGRKKYAITKWQQVVMDTRDLSANIIVTPRKYYNLFPDTENRNDLNTLNIDELHLAISTTQHSQEDIIGHDFTFKASIDILPVPSNSGLLCTEFKIISHMGSLDLSEMVGMYIIAYIQNKEDRTITAIGNYRITAKMPYLVIIEMKNANKRHQENLEAFVVGSVVLRREGQPTPMPTEHAFSSLLNPKNFGFMRKFYTHFLRDYGLTSIAEPQGVGKKYHMVRTALGEEYFINSAIAKYEGDKYRWSEWNFYEDLTSGINNAVIKKGNEFLITNGTAFRQVMKSIIGTEPYFHEKGQKGYLFHSRDQWRENSDFYKHNDYQEKALVTGMPEYLYIPVWKSLGKTSILMQIVFDICRQKIKGFNTSANLFDQLANDGKDELAGNPSIEKDVLRVDKDFGLDILQYKLVRKVLCAYLRLSFLMEDVSNDTNLQGMILKGFSLKVVGGLVHIVRHLVRLYEATKRASRADDRCNITNEDDVFWVLLSIAFIFLPEHFLNPLLGFQGDQASQDFLNKTLKGLGIDLTKFQKNQMFVSSSCVGSYKLSLILAQCIYKEAPELYNKMTDLGFPFLTYCLDLSESLFSEYMNPDTLSKFWNLIFFEGADYIKRRAQQVILSGLLTAIKDCRIQIMDSHSSQEILWHLNAYFMFNFYGTQFIADTLKVRKAYFISDNVGVGLVSQISSIFSGFTGGRSIEQEFQQIKSSINNDFMNVAVTNNSYIKYLKSVVYQVESSGKPLDIAHLRRFMDSWNIRLNSEENKLKLHFDDELQNVEYAIAEKPQVQNFSFGISSYDVGNYLPDKVKVTFETNFRREHVTMSPGSNEWFKVYTIDGGLIQNPTQAWIKVVMEGIDRAGKSFQTEYQFSLSRMRFNRTDYFYLNFNSFWMVISLRLDADHKGFKSDDVDHFGHLDHDFQHKGEIFCEEFADYMGIKKMTPYKEEIFNNSCTPNMLEILMNYALKSQSKFTAEFTQNVVKVDIFDRKTPNLFESMVRLILFSPLDNITVLRLLFNLLNKLDLTSEVQKVKRSHVQFLIWYILRVTQIYLPYAEIVSMVGTTLHESDSSIISAVVTSMTDTRKSSLNITDMLNLWFVAQRRRTGMSCLVIGSKGYLRELEKAIIFWQSEHQQPEYKFSKLNKLRVYFNCKGVTRKVEFRFDDTMRIHFDGKNRESEVTADHVLLLEDTEELLNFTQFTRIMTQFQILDWIFTRLTGLASDNAYGEYIKQIKAQEIRNLKSFEVQIKIRLLDVKDQKEHATDVGVVTLVKSNLGHLVDYRMSEVKQDHLIDNQNRMNFGGHLPTVKEVQFLDSDVSIREIVDQALLVAAHNVISVVDTNTLTYPYPRDCLELIKANTDEARVILMDRKLSPEHIEMPLSKISALLKDPPRLTMLLDIPRSSIERVYNHMAKDIYYLEGIDVVDNPFVPCLILSKNSAFAEVLFKNDNGNFLFTLDIRTVALDDVVNANYFTKQ